MAFKRSRATGSGRGRNPIGKGYSKANRARVQDAPGKSRVGNPPLSSWTKNSRRP